jgi:uncharacterized protein
VAAPPEGGRANAELVALLSGTLGVPRSGVRVLAGHASRRKIVEVDGLDGAALERLLERPD